MTHKTIDTYHSVLYSDDTGPRCAGYAISMTRMGAEEAANVRPKPIKNLKYCVRIVLAVRDEATYRAPMNMPTDLDAVCRTVAPHMMTAPSKTAVRRPKPSAT